MGEGKIHVDAVHAVQAEISQVTVDQLQTAVDTRLEDPALAQAATGREDEFTRLVLTRLVTAEVYDQVAQRYGVTVDDADVQARLDELLAGEDPEAVYAQAAKSYGREARPFAVNAVRYRAVAERFLALANAEKAKDPRADVTSAVLDALAWQARAAEHFAWAERIEFQRILDPRLKPGSYRLALTATDGAANRSTTARVGFRVKR